MLKVDVGIIIHSPFFVFILKEGQSKLQKKLQMGQNKTPMVSPEEELEEDEEEDGDEPAVYEIDIRSVRIGSMRTQPQQPMFISLHGVCFKCRCKLNSTDIF